MDKNMIRQARQVILSDYLLSHGEPLTKSGSRYRHKTHDSLVFTGNSFYWNSKSQKGNSIDFLMLFYGMDFKTAVHELLSFDGGISFPETTVTPQIKQEFQLSDLQLDINTMRIEKYLSEIRGIDGKIITDIISHSLMYQEMTTRNIIFPMYDEHKKAVGAEIHGSTTDGRYKGISRNSKYGYGYNIIFGEPKEIYFFESAIDLISFIDISKREGTSVANKIYVSMGGLKGNIIRHMSNLYDVTSSIFMCVDNDSAGMTFVEKMKQAYPSLTEMYPPTGKDWNEYLIRSKKN